MKKVFQIFEITSKEVCIPSKDFYSRNGDWCTEDIETLSCVCEFDTEDEAVKYLERIIDASDKSYTILPVFKKK